MKQVHTCLCRLVLAFHLRALILIHSMISCFIFLLLIFFSSPSHLLHGSFKEDSWIAREDTQVDGRKAVLGVIVTISGHLRRRLADGEQRVALRPIRTEPESTARCVPRAERHHWTRLFRELPVSYSAGRYARVSPMCGPPGGHGRGVPRLGGATPGPCRDDRRRRHLARGPVGGHGAGRSGGVGSRHLLLRSSDASEGGGGA